MQVIVSARHTTVAEGDRELIIDKIDRLGRLVPGMDRAEVHFSEQRNPRIADKEWCEVTIEGHGHHVRCKASGPDHLTAVDLCVEKLENKLHKLKSKLVRHRSARERTLARRMPAVAEQKMLDDEAVAHLEREPGFREELEAEVRAEEATALATEYRIVRSKTVEKLTLTPLEAAMRMDLLGHGFYFFTSAETGRPAVVYGREDGDVGLIDESA